MKSEDYNQNKGLRGINLVNLGRSIKLVFTGYLMIVAFGYVIAIGQLLVTHGMADGKFGLSINDIVYSYYGNSSGTVLEGKLTGSMKMNAKDEDRFKLIQWAREGGSQETYNNKIKTIVEQNCVLCHHAASSLPDFSQYDNLKKTVEPSQGASLQSLIRVSHIHLFGIGFLFMFMGIIFSLSTGVPHKFKYPVIVLPYCFLAMDVASWWLTKLNPNFAILVMISGIGLAISFTYMWVTSIYQMWFITDKYRLVDRRNAIMRD